MTRPLYCDESVWVPVADGLRRRGWAVHTASEQGTLGEPDEIQLEFAIEREWMLLTLDDDFLSLVEEREFEHAGILFVHQDGKRIGDIVRAVDGYLAEYDGNPSTIHYV